MGLHPVEDLRLQPADRAQDDPHAGTSHFDATSGSGTKSTSSPFKSACNSWGARPDHHRLIAKTVEVVQQSDEVTLHPPKTSPSTPYATRTRESARDSIADAPITLGSECRDHGPGPPRKDLAIDGDGVFRRPTGRGPHGRWRRVGSQGLHYGSGPLVRHRAETRPAPVRSTSSAERWGPQDRRGRRQSTVEHTRV